MHGGNVSRFVFSREAFVRNRPSVVGSVFPGRASAWAGTAFLRPVGPAASALTLPGLQPLQEKSIPRCSSSGSLRDLLSLGLAGVTCPPWTDTLGLGE